jgi:hypothetical protein
MGEFPASKDDGPTVNVNMNAQMLQIRWSRKI